MNEEILNNDMIKKLQIIEEKSIKRYLREEVKEMFNDVQNKCKDFKENVFYKQVAEIDEELLDIFPPYNNKKKKKRLKIYVDSDEENEQEEQEENK